MFLWNKAFNSDRIKFRINQIQQDLSAEESKKTNEQVAIDRVSVLEATIVRIMKGRKTLTLQLLIDAVVSDVSKRFPPDVKEMKKRVESLIEREVRRWLVLRGELTR
jgi:cullin-4